MFSDQISLTTSALFKHLNADFQTVGTEIECPNFFHLYNFPQIERAIIPLAAGIWESRAGEEGTLITD